MDYDVLGTGGVSVTGFSTVESVPPGLDIRRIGDALGVEHRRSTTPVRDPDALADVDGDDGDR